MPQKEQKIAVVVYLYQVDNDGEWGEIRFDFATGAALTGEKKYTLHFETLPPTLEGGFWSVTAYGEDDFLIDNSIDRYCINDRSDFKLNADGTLDIILSKDAPEDTSNWLPVSDGEFHLFMRIYVPDMTALDSWQPPVIREQ